jgi:hypothetical protein
MRYVHIPLPPNLPRRWPTLSNGRMTAMMLGPVLTDKLEYVRTHSGWGALKPWLAKYSFSKCWYCEAKSSRAPLDVDHFRPKLGVTIEGKALVGHSGYYWLAYTWSNFRLSCQRCNRPEKDDAELLRGKANEFPIRSENNRCTTAGQALLLEEPRLLDPCVEVDCDLLLHVTNGEIHPAAIDGTWEHQRARYTIDLFGLNSWNVPETKRGYWQPLDLLIKLVGNKPEVEAELRKHINCEHEYSSYFRSAISTHRYEPWIEDLLQCA